jgi:hypothetical protein
LTRADEVAASRAAKTVRPLLAMADEDVLSLNGPHPPPLSPGPRQSRDSSPFVRWPHVVASATRPR